MIENVENPCLLFSSPCGEARAAAPEVKSPAFHYISMSTYAANIALNLQFTHYNQSWRPEGAKLISYNFF